MGSIPTTSTKIKTVALCGRFDFGARGGMRIPSVGSQIGRTADLDGRSPPERSEGAGHGWPASIPTTSTNQKEKGCPQGGPFRLGLLRKRFEVSLRLDSPKRPRADLQLTSLTLNICFDAGDDILEFGQFAEAFEGPVVIEGETPAGPPTVVDC